jgi:Uma2 family endonuclease
MVSQIAPPRLVPGTRVPMTYEAFWALDTGGGPKVEWVDGEAIVHMTTLTRHARQTGFSFNLLSGFVRIFDLGEVFADQLGMDIPVRPSVRAPDILFVAREHAALLQRRGLFGAADLIMEFASQDSITRDYREKYEEYRRAGVREYIIVDSREGKHRFVFYRLDANGDYAEVTPDTEGRYHSSVLPGFWINPDWFWQEPLPIVEDVLFDIAGDAYTDWLMSRRRTTLNR